MLWAGTGSVLGKNLCMRRHKSSERLRIFIIDSGDFVAAEVAHLLYHWLVVIIAIVVIHR
jgi:hypothetical protein